VAQRRTRTRLPEALRPLFWEYDFTKLSLESDRGLIVRRMVSMANARGLEWLRATLGDDVIREEIEVSKARGIPYRRVRPWISAAQYHRWARERPPSLWEAR
jgi:hypothetical protein